MFVRQTNINHPHVDAFDIKAADQLRGSQVRFVVDAGHHATEQPMRAAIQDHLYSLRRHSPHRVFYLNIAMRRVPSYLLEVKFDLDAVIANHVPVISAPIRKGFVPGAQASSIHTPFRAAHALIVVRPITALTTPSRWDLMTATSGTRLYE